jgi:uncharacterized Zn finger protein
MKPKKIKTLQAKSKRLTVRVIDPVYPDDPYAMIVSSGTQRTLNRIVTVKFERDSTITARCTCRWAQFGGAACSHVIAALQKLAERKQRKLSFWLTAEEAHRQKQSLFRLRNGGDDIWITSRHPA